MNAPWKEMRQVCAACDIWAFRPLVNHICKPTSPGAREWKLQASRRLETSLEDGSILHENYKETIVGPKLLPNIYDKYTEVHVLEATPATLAAGEMRKFLDDAQGELRTHAKWWSDEGDGFRANEAFKAAETIDKLLARIASSEGGG